jgi:hypothetical protein
MAVVGECKMDLGWFATLTLRAMCAHPIALRQNYFDVTRTTNQVVYGGLQYWAAFF